MAAKAAPQYIAGLSSAFGACCLGAVIGWSAPVQEAVENGEAYGFSVSSDEFGSIGSMMTLGGAVVCVPIGFMISWIGRKPTMLLLVPPFIIGWLLMIFAKNVIMLCAGRFVLGICGGAFCITAPMYTTEIAQVERRGTMGSFFQLLIVHGILFGFVVGGLTSVLQFNIICACLPIIFAVIFIFMPESPVYYISKGQPEKATKSLAWLRGKDYDVSEEIATMQAENDKSKSVEVSVGKAICRKVTLKSLGISISLMIFQQVTGINAIMFYSTSIFKDANTGFSEVGSTILIGVIQVFATIFAVLFVDKIGRRLLLMTSAFLMGVACGLMGVYFHKKGIDETSVSSLGWLPVSSVCIFIVAFSIGFGPVPWLIMAELFSEDIKSVAGSIAGTSNWVLAFVVTKVFPILKVSLGAAICFWIFTAMAIVAFFFILFIVPETKGKTIAEIQTELGGTST